MPRFRWTISNESQIFFPGVPISMSLHVLWNLYCYFETENNFLALWEFYLSSSFHSLAFILTMRNVNASNRKQFMHIWLTEYYVTSGSYEDSLKSLHQRTINGGHIRHTSLMRRGNDVSTRRRQRHNSICGDVVHLDPDVQQQPKTAVHMTAANSSLVRRAHFL